MKIDHFREVDFDKYHTFFLEYWKDDYDMHNHILRPCTATYEEISTNSAKLIQLDATVLSFSHDATLPEILLECAIRGLNPDFIDIKVVPDEYKKNRWSDKSEKIIEVIDTHKEDVCNRFDTIEAPQYYIALNKHKTEPLKHLIIDSFNQDANIDMLHGKYDVKAIVAGFKDYDSAVRYCKKLNDEI